MINHSCYSLRTKDSKDNELKAVAEYLKHWAGLLTTNPEYFPIQSKLKHFSYE